MRSKNPSIGISIYPDFYEIDTILNYIKQAKDLGYEKVFSTIQLGELNFENASSDIDYSSWIQIFKYCKKENLQLAIDVNPESLKKIGASCKNLKPLSDMYITCIRLDGGFSNEEFLDLINNNYGIKIEENCSNIKTTMTRLSILSNQGEKNLQLCFNFFPLINTGHSYEYVKLCIESIRNKCPHIKISAFISDKDAKNDLCNVNSGIVTIEKQRYKDIEASYLELVNMGINEVIFGEGFVLEKSLQKLSEVKSLNTNFLKINFYERVALKDQQLILNKICQDREDSSEDVLRLTDFRNKLHNIAPNCTQQSLNKYEVFCENELVNKRYQGEVKISLTNLSWRNHWNLVGWIDPNYYKLVEIYKENKTKFIFK